MATINKENNQKPLFELKETQEDKLIYQRVINSQGRTKKQIDAIVNQLPTATIHVISEDDFQRLKRIEEELNSKIILTKDKQPSFKGVILKFLEL